MKLSLFCSGKQTANSIGNRYPEQHYGPSQEFFRLLEQDTCHVWSNIYITAFGTDLRNMVTLRSRIPDIRPSQPPQMDLRIALGTLEERPPQHGGLGYVPMSFASWCLGSGLIQ